MDQDRDRDAMIMRCFRLGVRELREREKFSAELRQERRELEEALNMTREEIALHVARRLLR